MTFMTHTVSIQVGKTFENYLRISSIRNSDMRFLKKITFGKNFKDIVFQKLNNWRKNWAQFLKSWVSNIFFHFCRNLWVFLEMSKKKPEEKWKQSKFESLSIPGTSSGPASLSSQRRFSSLLVLNRRWRWCDSFFWCRLLLVVGLAWWLGVFLHWRLGLLFLFLQGFSAFDSGVLFLEGHLMAGHPSPFLHPWRRLAKPLLQTLFPALGLLGVCKKGN